MPDTATMLERRYRQALTESVAAQQTYAGARTRTADARCARADEAAYRAADALRAWDPVRGQQVIDRLVMEAARDA